MAKKRKVVKRVRREERGKRKEKREVGMKGSILAVILGIAVIAGVIYAVRMMNFNIPPAQPYAKRPIDGEVVPRDIVLEWGCEDPDGDRLTYDLYLGEGTPVLVATSLTFPSYRAKLLPGRVYRWKVVARDGRGGVSESPVWTFRTQENRSPGKPAAIFPSPSSTLDSTLIKLSWRSSDPDGDPVVYDLYVDGVLVASGLKEPSYEVEVAPGEKHIWRVVARDPYGGRSEGEWWFRVRRPNSPPEVEIEKIEKGEGWIRVFWRAEDPDKDRLEVTVTVNGSDLSLRSGEKIDVGYGEHTIVVRASDGELETRASTTVVLKEPLPPEKPQVLSSLQTLAGEYGLSWKAFDPDSTQLTFEIYVDGEKVARTTEENLKVDLTPGKHRIRIVAVDEGGRKSESEIVVSVIEPRLTLNVPEIVWEPSLNIEWDFPTDALYELRIDGKVVYRGKGKEATVRVGMGRHEVELIAEAMGRTFKKKEIVERKRPYEILALSKGEGLYLIKVGERMEIVDQMGLDGRRMDFKGNLAAVAGEYGDVYIIGVEENYLALVSIVNLEAVDVAVGDGSVYVLSDGKVYEVSVDGRIVGEKGVGRALGLDYTAGRILVYLEDGILELDDDLNTLRSWRTKGKVLKAIVDGDVVALEDWGVERLGGEEIELPSPLDIEEFGSGFVVADRELGVVFLDGKLRVVSSVDLKGVKAVSVKEGEVIAFGRGVYRIRDGEVVERLGSGEEVLSVCGDFKGTDGGLYLNGRKIFGGRVERLECEDDLGAFKSEGELLIYDGKVWKSGLRVGDFGVWGGKVYAISKGRLLRIENGKGIFVANADSFGDGYYSKGREIWKVGDGRVAIASSKVRDLASDGRTVAALEDGRVEIFEGSRVVGRIDGEFEGVKVDGIVVLWREDRVYAYDASGRKIWSVPLYGVRDVDVGDGKVLIADGFNGLVALDLRSGEVLEDEVVLACGDGG